MMDDHIGAKPFMLVGDRPEEEVSIENGGLEKVNASDKQSSYGVSQSTENTQNNQFFNISMQDIGTSFEGEGFAICVDGGLESVCAIYSTSLVSDNDSGGFGVNSLTFYRDAISNTEAGIGDDIRTFDGSYKSIQPLIFQNIDTIFLGDKGQSFAKASSSRLSHEIRGAIGLDSVDAGIQPYNLSISGDGILERNSFSGFLNGSGASDDGSGGNQSPVQDESFNFFSRPVIVSIEDVVASEDDGMATFTVSIPFPYGVPITIDYTAPDGTMGTLVFAPGETTQTFVTTWEVDDLDELDEVLTATISNPVNAIILDGLN